MHLSEILTHLGEERENYLRAIAPPVFQTSNFAFRTLDEFRQALSNELDANLYTRGNNPTVEILRKKMAALEGAEDALLFGSGSGAIAAAVLSNVEAGDHLICVDKPYSWTKILITQFLPRFGVSHTFVDGRSVANIEAAIQPNTTLLYLESPNSLTFELQDLAACAELARKHGLTTCIDNSYASPIFQNPIKYGIDIVIHSGTKYLNGHSDVMVGAVCGKREMIQRLFANEYMTLGGILSPHDAALTLRGLRTLEIRMQRCHDSCVKVVEFLENHSKVERVLFPWSPSFPQYELARRQMSGAGGLFSAYLKVDSLEKAEAVFHRLQHFLLAASWGGYESLVLPSAAFYNVPGREDTPMPWTLFRFSIGLEDPDWLIADLEQALEIV